MSQTYHEQIDYKNTMKLRELQKDSPLSQMISFAPWKLRRQPTPDAIMLTT